MGHFLLEHFHEIHERSEHMEDFEKLSLCFDLYFVCLFIHTLPCRLVYGTLESILIEGYFYENLFTSFWERGTADF